MLLFNSIGPNPHVVRMLIAEKKLDIPVRQIDLVKGENRESAYLALNPAGQLPALQLDSGKVITEVTAICEYLEEIKPDPALIGENSEERAEARMWIRWVDIQIVQPVTLGFRFGEGADFFTGREPVFRDAADSMKQFAQIKLEWLNAQLEGKRYICGDRFTFADILLFCFLDFADNSGQPLNPNFENIVNWKKRVAERDSAKA